MDDGVCLELRLLRERLAALRALIWPLTAMHPHVTLQSLLLTECPAASAASEWCLARVGALMSLQIALRREGLPACRALEVLPGDALKKKAWQITVILWEVGGHCLFCFNSSSCSTNKSLSDAFIMTKTRKTDQLMLNRD